MKKIRGYIIALSLLPFSGNSYAQVEDWYTYWGIGVSDHTYPGDVQKVLDDLESAPGIERTEGSIDMLGFYVPLPNVTSLIGFVISASYDNFKAEGAEMQVNHYLYSVSTMHFFGTEPGQGFYVRGDAGMSKMLVTSSFNAPVASESGYGALAGIGYGFKLSEESRLLLNANYSLSRIEEENTSTFSFNIAGLW